MAPVRDIGLMKSSKSAKKAQVRLALSSSPLSTAKVAEQTGISSDRLYGFLSKGYLNYQDVQKLADYLQDRGLFDEKPIRHKSTTALLAAELRVLAEILECDELPIDIRIQRYQGWIEWAFGSLPEYKNLLEKQR